MCTHAKTHMYTYNSQAVTCTQVHTPPTSEAWFSCLLRLGLGSRSSISAQLGGQATEPRGHPAGQGKLPGQLPLALGLGKLHPLPHPASGPQGGPFI